MTNNLVERRRTVPLVIIALMALIGALVVAAAGHVPANADMGMGQANAAAPAVDTMSQQMTGHPVILRTNAQAAFHDAMRKLWEDHVTWTRLAIVTFADGSKGFPTTAARLMQNQTDIGNAIKPYYGNGAGNKLTSLLDDHITIAVEIMEAAKAGDTAAFNAANTRWNKNARDIADFLHAANPHFIPRQMMRNDMRVHLQQTLAEAADELSGNYAAGVAEYGHVHTHILAMADMLSSGIMNQFPARFR